MASTSGSPDISEGSPGVHEHDVGGGGEVEGDAAGLEGHEEDGDAGLVGEGADHAVACLHAHAALQAHAPDAHPAHECGHAWSGHDRLAGTPHAAKDAAMLGVGMTNW